MFTHLKDKHGTITYICNELYRTTMKKKSIRKHQYDFSQTISELNKSFSLITDLVQLRNNFVARIKEIANTKLVIVFLLDPDYNRFNPVAELDPSDQDSREIYFNPGDKMIFWLNVNKILLNIPENNEVFDFFSKREKSILKKLNAEIVYPFVIMNQVKGFVLLGGKESGRYSQDELHILTTLFEQASFAFENALLYMQQRERSSKMYRADRMATLGELAAGTAHEIRNPLTSIRSTIQYLSNRIDDHEDKELAQGLISEVDRINGIIQDMLSFAKPEDLRIEETDFRGLISQILRLVESSAKNRGIEVEMNYKSKRKTINVDNNLIMQALINILMNAIQAIESPNGRILIEVRDIVLDKRNSDRDFMFLLEIRDNGSGIPKDLQEKIFDPFFTTKQEGTGLGLSITYSIIHRHRGEIEFQSEQGKGTVVKIRLPGNVTKRKQ